MARIGVFVCHCGENIGRTVDCAKVAEALENHPGVVHSVDYKYMCSDPGQALIKQAIAEKNLTGVVVAACSPHMHEKTFRRAASARRAEPLPLRDGQRPRALLLDPRGPGAATEKAIDIGRTIVEKVKRNVPLETIHIPVTKRALVIGGGIAGIQAALDIADGGGRGGPRGEGALHRRAHEPAQRDLPHPRLLPVHPHAAHGGGLPAPQHQALHYSELESLEGYIGNFKVTIRRKARSVDETSATAAARAPRFAPRRRSPASSTRGWASAPRSTCPSPRPCPTSRHRP